MASPQTIQPPNIDTNIRENNATTNYGTATTFYVSPNSGGVARFRSILKFDFSAVVPSEATITLARLSLYCYNNANGRTISVFRLLRTDWVETQATWNIYKTGSSWSTAGALSDGNDFTSTDAATAPSVEWGNWLNETVTAQVQTALSSVSGVAHFLVADVGASTVATNQYVAREYTADTTWRPKLYVEYTVPGGVVIASVKTVNGLAVASVKTREGLAIANVKRWNG